LQTSLTLPLELIAPRQVFIAGNAKDLQGILEVLLNLIILYPLI